LQRINNIYEKLEIDAVPHEANIVNLPKFDSIRFENISYQYDTDDKSSFALNSLNLTIRKGEIIFIVGGNGSGKSTFINLFTGLCKPSEGKIFIDGQETGWEQYASFSNSMAVVYTNQHLFRENYDNHDLSEQNGLLKKYMSMFNLNGILRIDPVRNHIDANISKGEQKRLGLLLSLLEDKPIIVLDEWAAEQDPKNRKYFYTKWLAEIAQLGKTIIAVSHDDDFYHVADRVIKFNYGKEYSISFLSPICRR
jgi:ABC-type siderophore export system fused ATPase/permease subunit